MSSDILEVEHPRQFFARNLALASLYFSIAEKEYCSCLEYEGIETSELPMDEVALIDDQSTRSAVKSIVFAAMCVESAINNYGGTYLGDNYFNKHLAGLDVVSKWVVIPKLVCGNSIDKSGPAFSSLKALIACRNELIHNKSYEVDFSDMAKLHEKLEKTQMKFECDFLNSMKCLYLLSFEMDYVVGPTRNPLGTFHPKVNIEYAPPDIVKDLFITSRELIKKQYS